MIFLIIVKLFAFITTLIMVKPELAPVAKGVFIPSAPVRIIGTDHCFFRFVCFYCRCLLPVLTWYRNAGAISPGIVQTGSDSFTGILLLGRNERNGNDLRRRCVASAGNNSEYCH